MSTDAARKYELPIFRKRLDELRGQISYADFAAFLGISRATVGFYLAGKRVPNAADLKKIAEKCHVSTDWLVGLDAAKTHEQSGFAAKLGLSGETVEKLAIMEDLFRDRNLSGALDALLSSKELPALLVALSSVASAKQAREHTLKERALGNLNEQQAYENGADSIPLSPAAYINYRSYCAKQSFDAMIDDILNRLTEKED